MPLASVIIPTLGRRDSLRDCLESLWVQSEQDFEIIKVTQEGPLARLRNEGAKRAKGKYLLFIDDDVICSPRWLESIIRVFDEKGVAGVSGPAFIRKEYRRNRDIFKFGWLYDLLFLGRKRTLPGHILRSGAWTTGASRKSCSYEGPVQFLEACNMAFVADLFHEFGGFDEAYGGLGDWSEPDLAFRIRRAGHELWFARDALVEHRPSREGAFKKRSSDSAKRLANYELFSSRYIKPCWQHNFYKFFIKLYYEIKTLK